MDTKGMARTVQPDSGLGGVNPMALQVIIITSCAAAGGGARRHPFESTPHEKLLAASIIHLLFCGSISRFGKNFQILFHPLSSTKNQITNYTIPIIYSNKVCIQTASS